MRLVERAEAEAGEMILHGEFQAAVTLFDACVFVEPDLWPWLWQRGLALYYLESYDEACAQFDDVRASMN